MGEKQEEWNKAFSASDTDGSGYIERDELPAVFEKLNVRLDEKSTKNVVTKFDKNKDGKLDQKEFENMVNFLVEQKTKVQETQNTQNNSSVPTASQMVQSLQKKTVKAPPKKIATPSIISRIGKITGALKEKTQQTVQRVDGLFMDSSFSPNDSVLTKQYRGKGIIWRRPSEIIDEPKMFVAGTEEGDVKQGHIGNCWFVGALAVVAASGSDLVEDLFVRYSLEEGRHHIRFYKDFDWVVVEVDDLLPCLPDGRLLYAKCPDPHEFWVPLVEKAYAKLHGGYDQIESGTITDALRDLTGEGVEVIDLRNTENKDELWPVLLNNTKESFLMGCAIESTGPAERLTNEGLLTNHAYSILDTREFKDHRLIRVRNPWGQGEWKGAWSDGSKEWNIPGAKKALDYIDENDGTFYMSFKDFSARFNIIHVLRLLLDEVGEVWQKKQFKSEWKRERKTAGGCTDHATWPQNPQFSVSSSFSNNKVFVCLSQPDQRYATDSNQIHYEPIGAVVVSGNDDKYKKTTLKRDEVVLRPHYAPRRDLSFEFTANPGKSYIIIPTAFRPDVDIEFELAIYTQKSAQVIQREGEIPKKKTKGEWKGKTAGGCPNFPTWVDNPQFIVSSLKTAKVTFELKQKTKNKKELDPLGLFVFPAGQRVVSYSSNPPVYNSPSFTPIAVIQGETTLEAGKTYVVLPCVFNPGKEKRFSLSVTFPDPEIINGISLRAI